MLAQDNSAKRLPPDLYVAQILEILEEENPAIFKWILSFGDMIDEHMEEGFEKAWLKFQMLANVGIVYSTIKAQIEGNYLDQEYGGAQDPEPEEQPPKKRKQPRRGKKNNKRGKK
jgi:hypothetical protein